MEVQKEHTLAAYTGTVSTLHSAAIMATVGTKGQGNIRHHSIEQAEQHLRATVYYDIGTYTSTTSTDRNDSTAILQTSTRIYMVSKHRPEGAPLSMAEVRVTAPVTPTCTTLVHVQQHNYQVIQSGTLTCTTPHGISTTSTVQAGQFFSIDNKDTCHSTCIEVGPRPFQVIKKNMPNQPTVHHDKMLQGIIAHRDRQEAPPPKNAGQGDHIMHSILDENIRDAKDMLDELKSNAEGPDNALHAGLVGAVLSSLLAVLLLAIIVRSRCGWRCCRARRRPCPPSTRVDSGNNNNSAEFRSKLRKQYSMLLLHRGALCALLQ
jgi:hypothetical protein